MAENGPTLSGVLETVLYYGDQERARRFYTEVLGMRLLHAEPGRSLFFRVGGSVFLLFDAEKTLEGERLPAHGASGPVHTCFRVPPEDYEAWKRRLSGHGVPVLREVDWEPGLSFYFHDSEGNLLEIADRDFWPR